jgi:hypothetical protein
MAQTLTASLVATALQKLEAIRHSEAEVLSDQECQKRAEEVAEAALEAIAVCTKYLLSRNAEARIDGFGNFYLRETQIQFVPDEDVLQYAFLKYQEPEQHQLALRNAFVRMLSQAQEIIPLLDLTSDAPVSAEDGDTTPEQKLLDSIFGKTHSTRFDPTVSVLLTRIIRELREAGAEISTADAVSDAIMESPETGAPSSSSCTQISLDEVMRQLEEVRSAERRLRALGKTGGYKKLKLTDALQAMRERTGQKGLGIAGDEIETGSDE